MRIKEIREKLGMTQQDVIDKASEFGAKFTQQQLSRWENGYSVSKKNLKYLAQVLGCNESELFDNSKEATLKDAEKIGFDFGIECAKNGLSVNSFVSEAKKYGYTDLSGKEDSYNVNMLMQFVLKESATLGIPISPEIVNIKTTEEVALFYIHAYNAILDYNKKNKKED